MHPLLVIVVDGFGMMLDSVDRSFDQPDPTPGAAAETYRRFFDRKRRQALSIKGGISW